MQSARGGGLKIPRNSLENEVDFQFPKTSRNSKFFSVFISGRIQARPEGNSVQPFVLPGFYFIFFSKEKQEGDVPLGIFGAVPGGNCAVEPCGECWIRFFLEGILGLGMELGIVGAHSHSCFLLG